MSFRQFCIAFPVQPGIAVTRYKGHCSLEVKSDIVFIRKTNTAVHLNCTFANVEGGFSAS